MKLGKIFICINILVLSLLMLTGCMSKETWPRIVYQPTYWTFNNHSPTISCGCLSKSSGELKIEYYNYQTQYVIPELSKFMPFDFAIFKNGKLVCLIE